VPISPRKLAVKGCSERKGNQGRAQARRSDWLDHDEDQGVTRTSHYPPLLYEACKRPVPKIAIGR